MKPTEATGTSTVAVGVKNPGVRFERKGAAVVLTLDRPDRLNAVNSGMKAAISRELPRIARDPQVYAVLLQASPARMFSAGGDIREYYDLATTNPTLAAAEFANEYSLIWLLDCFSKPTIAFIDGAMMGTAVGLVQCATHRVAGPGYRFQMPETAIGFFPDNGVAWHLARLPGEVGTWLALTGASIGPADALHLDLITHVIAPSRFDEAAAAIADCQPIDQILDAMSADPGPAPLADVAVVIERCFSADDMSEIMRRLEAETEHRDWCASQLATLASRSPLALAVTLEYVRRARHLDLRQTLVVDHRLAVRMVTSHDFQEGVRTRIIEKQGEPQWRPSVASEVSRRQIERLFDPLDEGELNVPTRQEMQPSRP